MCSTLNNSVCLLSFNVFSISIFFYALDKLTLKDASQRFIVGVKRKQFVREILYYI